MLYFYYYFNELQTLNLKHIYLFYKKKKIKRKNMDKSNKQNNWKWLYE